MSQEIEALKKEIEGLEGIKKALMIQADVNKQMFNESIAGVMTLRANNTLLNNALNDLNGKLKQSENEVVQLKAQLAEALEAQKAIPAIPENEVIE